MTGHHRLQQGAESLVSQLQAGQAALVALLGEDPLREVAEHPSPGPACDRVWSQVSQGEEIFRSHREIGSHPASAADFHVQSEWRKQNCPQ